MQHFFVGTFAYCFFVPIVLISIYNIKYSEVGMSITVNIYYTGKNGSAIEFANEMRSSGIVDAVRAEEGNERYEYFLPMDDKETVLLIDRWRNQQAIDAHHKSDMMKSIAELRTKYKLKMRVEKFES